MKCRFGLFLRGTAQSFFESTRYTNGISPEYWGNNLATEAAQAMLQFGFQYLGFDEIIASAAAPNAASFRVMEKTGMKFLKRENKNGLDTIFYSIAKKAFRFDDSVQFISHKVEER